MNFSDIKLIVSNYQGQIVDYGSKGLLILDCTGNHIVHISPIKLTKETEVLDSIQKFFSQFGTPVTNTDKRNIEKKVVHINTNIAILDNVFDRDRFLTVLKMMAAKDIVLCKFHFETKIIAWENLLSPVLKACDEFIKEHRIIFQLFGPFEKIEDSTKNFLFTNKFQLHCVTDSVRCSLPLRHVIKNLAEYGFRVPCIWYVDEKNVGQIGEIIDEIMDINFHAGFALPLSSENFFKKNIADPTNLQYLQLIVDTYHKYPYYDDVFYPLNRILQKCVNNQYFFSSFDYQWNPHDSEFQKIIRNSNNIDRIHDFLYRAFLWQRWVIQNTYQDHSDPEIVVNENTI